MAKNGAHYECRQQWFLRQWRRQPQEGEKAMLWVPVDRTRMTESEDTLSNLTHQLWTSLIGSCSRTRLCFTERKTLWRPWLIIQAVHRHNYKTGKASQKHRGRRDSLKQQVSFSSLTSPLWDTTILECKSRKESTNYLVQEWSVHWSRKKTSF